MMRGMRSNPHAVHKGGCDRGVGRGRGTGVGFRRYQRIENVNRQALARLSAVVNRKNAPRRQ